MTVVAVLLFTTKLHAQIAIRAVETGGAEVYSLRMDAWGGLSSVFYGMANRVPSDTMGMLRMPQFTKELELLEDQLEQIREIEQVMQKQTRDILRTADFSGDAAKVVREAQRAIRKQTEEKLEKILLPIQLKRLKQIQIQLQMRNRGASAVASDALAEALGLSDEQKRELTEKQQEAQKKLQAEIQRIRDELRQEVIQDVLTKSQLRKLEKLVGDKYEVKKPEYRSFTRFRPSSSGEKKE